MFCGRKSLVLTVVWDDDVATEVRARQSAHVQHPSVLEKAESSRESEKSLEDCFKIWNAEEELAGVQICQRCKSEVRPRKRLQLYRLPRILIVHLKRFKRDTETFRWNRVSTPIRIPTKGFDLKAYLAESASRVSDAGLYDLFAAANHYGGLNCGHYTSVAQTISGEWLYFDDAVTGKANPEDLTSSAAPYVLFYRRRNDTDEISSIPARG